MMCNYKIICMQSFKLLFELPYIFGNCAQCNLFIYKNIKNIQLLTLHQTPNIDRNRLARQMTSQDKKDTLH